MEVSEIGAFAGYWGAAAIQRSPYWTVFRLI